jgi:hypothetical protein
MAKREKKQTKKPIEQRENPVMAGNGNQIEKRLWPAAIIEISKVRVKS